MRPKFDSAELHSQIDSRFRAPLMSFFLRRTGDRLAAEDLTQDVFERLLRANERGEIDDVEALVFVTAANLLKDRGRKQQRRAEAQLHDLDVPAVSAITREFLEDRSPERVLLARESVADVLRVLDELGPRVRDVFILFRLEGMRHAEIATLYGISRSTVEKDIMRATARLTLRFGAPAVSAPDESPAYVRAVVEAAAWRSRLTESGVDGSDAHDDWLAADPLHRQAWDETQSTWHFIEEFSAFPEMIDARQAALARAQRHARSRGGLLPHWLRRGSARAAIETRTTVARRAAASCSA